MIKVPHCSSPSLRHKQEAWQRSNVKMHVEQNTMLSRAHLLSCKVSTEHGALVKTELCFCVMLRNP